MIDKLKKLYQDQFYGFVVRMVVVYGVWRVLLKASQVIEPFKVLWGKMMGVLLKIITSTSLLQLKIMGYNVKHHDAFLAIKGSAGVVVGPACIGIGVMFIYIGLILTYYGSKKLQLKFVVGGLFLINFLNALRVTILCIISKYNNDWVEFNHKIVFNNLLYVCIILMWIWYANITNKSIVNTEKDNNAKD
jgi:exosortase/archaeosortase family protein